MEAPCWSGARAGGKLRALQRASGHHATYGCPIGSLKEARDTRPGEFRMRYGSAVLEWRASRWKTTRSTTRLRAPCNIWLSDRKPERGEGYAPWGVSDEVWKRRVGVAREQVENYALYNAPPGTMQHMAVRSEA